MPAGLALKFLAVFTAQLLEYVEQCAVLFRNLGVSAAYLCADYFHELLNLVLGELYGEGLVLGHFGVPFSLFLTHL